ncbi:MAG: hypothetical protein H0X33_14435 [Taibaiella sp.]|nr:hypothetical protein [Taibaiella sp.]
MLDKVTLAASLETAFSNRVPGVTSAQTTAMTALANDIANAIDTYVKGMQIAYTTGLVNGAGAVTGAFGNIIS